MQVRSIASRGSAVKRTETPDFSAANVSAQAVGADLDPLLTIDHFRIRAPKFPPHPHAGFSAVTYLFEDGEGTFMSRDSRGNTHVATPGAVIWTVAGSGVLHEEFPLERGKQSHGLQIFLNLSAEAKRQPPRSLFVDGPDVPVLTADGVRVRIAAGSHGGVPARIDAPGDITLLEVQMDAGASFEHVLPSSHSAIVYVIEGQVRIGAETLAPFDVATLGGDGDAIALRAASAARVIVLAGPPLREPVVQHGPFAMNSAADINAAVDRFHRGEMGQLEPYQFTKTEPHA